MKHFIIFLSFSVLLLSSCVTLKEFDEQSALSQKYLVEKKDCNENLQKTTSQLEDAQEKLEALQQKNSSLLSSVNSLKKSSDELSRLAEEEKKLREKTDLDLESHMLSASEKQEKMLQEISEKERALTKREADLKNSKQKLEEKSLHLKNLNDKILEKEIKISESQTSIQEKMDRIAVLESKIDAQKSKMSALKNSVTSALKNFTSEELTIQEKEGKIFVSLSEKLLFKPGSFTLDENGNSAITQLAAVLIKQKDVDIIVEGHTDSDALSGTGAIKDNWDLSVKRATTVIRILEKNNVPKDKLIASGRSMHFPISENETKEGKAKNRRTEIILSPNIEKLFEILEEK